MQLQELLFIGINEMLKLRYKEEDLIIRINPITYIELAYGLRYYGHNIIDLKQDNFPNNTTYRGVEVQKGIGDKIHIISNHLYRNEYVEIDEKKGTFKLIK